MSWAEVIANSNMLFEPARLAEAFDYAELHANIARYSWMLDFQSRNPKNYHLESKFYDCFFTLYGHRGIKRELLTVTLKTSICKNRLSLDDILRRLNNNKYHYSYATKIYNWINPDSPIWDSNVRKALQAPRCLSGDRNCHFANLNVAINKMLREREAQASIKMLEHSFPTCKTMPPVRKLDFVLWSLGAMKD